MKNIFIGLMSLFAIAVMTSVAFGSNGAVANDSDYTVEAVYEGSADVLSNHIDLQKAVLQPMLVAVRISCWVDSNESMPSEVFLTPVRTYALRFT